jgi:hypothetical protein
MPADRECPKCGQQMEYQEYDPDCGIMSAGWFCAEDGCEEIFVYAEDYYPEEDYP